MSDDTPFLRELARVAHEEEAEERSRLDDRWDRLSAGELTPEEEAELRALAETSGKAREAYEAFRPLGQDFQAGVVRAVQAQGLAPEAEAAALELPAKVVPFPKRAARVWWSAIAATAAAAVLVLFLRPPAPLPDYGIPTVSGVQATRGELPETPEVQPLAPGRFQVILQPETSVSRLPALEARCYLLRGRDLRRLEIREQEHDPGGSISIEGSIGGEVRPGRWTLWSVVGRPGKLPEDAELRSLLPGKDQLRRRDWVALPTEVRILPEGSSS